MSVNQHGIEGEYYGIGSYFYRVTRHADGTVEKGAPGHGSIFVPNVCLDCPLLDGGEFGDYGSQLSPPYCMANVWFPTRKGTCKRRAREEAS